MKKEFYVIIFYTSLVSFLIQATDNQLVKKEKTFSQNVLQKCQVVGNFGVAGLCAYLSLNVCQPIAKDALLPLAGVFCTEGVRTCLVYGGPMGLLAGVITAVPLYVGLKCIDDGFKKMK